MIKLRNINKKFNNRTLFKDFNLDIPLNQLTFISGESGIGKTTLLNIIGGLETVSREETVLIELPNRFIDLKDKKNKHLIDFVFEDFNLLPDLNCLDNIKLGKNILGKKFNKKETIKLLEDFGISKDVYLEKVKNLSFGEMQRISIIRVISRDSKILLVDEPTANLDEENSKIVFKLLKEISKTKTVIVVTHDTESANLYGDNVILLDENEVKYTKQFNQDIQIVADESLNKIIETSKTRNKTLSFSNKFIVAPRLALIEFRKKWIQFLLILISMFITIFTLLMVLNFAVGNPRIFGNINETQFDMINLSKSNGEVVSADEKQLVVNKSVVEKTVDKYNVNLSITYNQNDINNVPQNEKFNLNYRQIDSSDFFRNRIIVGNEIKGSFFENENEIIISEELVSRLKITDPIGKNIQIIYDYNTAQINNVKTNDVVIIKTPLARELKIIGINKVLENRFQGEKLEFSYLNSSLLKKIREEIISKNTAPTAMSFSSFGSGKKYETINNVKITQQEVNENDVTNRYLNESERFSKYYVYISTALAQRIKENPDVSDLAAVRYTITVNGQQSVVIVAGSFDSSDLEIRLKSENYKFLTEIKPDSLDIYYKPYVNLEEDAGFWKSNPFVPYVVVNHGQALRNVIFKNTTTFYIIGTIVIAISTILLILFSFVFSKIIVSSKKKEIGILKSLGASKSQIYFYNITNMLTLSFVNYILVLILFYPLYFLLSTFITFFALSIPNPYQLFLWMFLIWISLTFVTLASYSIILFLTIKKPYKKLMS